MRLLLSKRAIVSRLAGLFLLAAALGWLFDLTTEFLLLLALGIIAWHYKHLFLLDKWLWRDR